MAGISISTSDAAPLSPPPEPPAAEGHGGGADHDNDTFVPLLDLLERFPDLFAQKVLAHLDTIDRTFLAQTGGACRAAVAASGLPRAGTRRRVLGRSVWRVWHQLDEFVGSVERLAWAKASGCPWDAWTCAYAARIGCLDVLQWAREQGCPWDSVTCEHAADGGHLEVLRWARAHDCPWNTLTCYYAAYNGHLGLLQWARENGCPWSKWDCVNASWRHPETQAWARAQPGEYS
jgi:hypothetical protein